MGSVGDCYDNASNAARAALAVLDFIELRISPVRQSEKYERRSQDLMPTATIRGNGCDPVRGSILTLGRQTTRMVAPHL